MEAKIYKYLDMPKNQLALFLNTTAIFLYFSSPILNIFAFIIENPLLTNYA